MKVFEISIKERQIKLMKLLCVLKTGVNRVKFSERIFLKDIEKVTLSCFYCKKNLQCHS